MGRVAAGARVLEDLVYPTQDVPTQPFFYPISASGAPHIGSYGICDIQTASTQAGMAESIVVVELSEGEDHGEAAVLQAPSSGTGTIHQSSPCMGTSEKDPHASHKKRTRRVDPLVAEVQDLQETRHQILSHLNSLESRIGSLSQDLSVIHLKTETIQNTIQGMTKQNKEPSIST